MLIAFQRDVDWGGVYLKVDWGVYLKVRHHGMSRGICVDTVDH